MCKRKLGVAHPFPHPCISSRKDLSLLLFTSHFVIYCVCLGLSTSLQELVFSFYPWDQTGVVRFGTKCLYQVRHLARSDDDDEEEEDVDDACVWHMCLQVCCAYMHVHVCVHTCEGCWD